MALFTLQKLNSAKEAGALEDFIEKAITGHDVISLNNNELLFKSENPELTSLKIQVHIEGESPIDLTPKRKKYSGFAKIIVNHGVSRLWDNPVQLDDNFDKKVLGEYFDEDVKEYARWAAIHGVSWVYYNNGNPLMFKATEFIPLLDEWDSSIQAGIRFWQLGTGDSDAPMFIQLYEMDGITMWKKMGDEMVPIDADRNPVSAPVQMPYSQDVVTFPAGAQFTQASPRKADIFPIVPYYFNPQRASEFSRDVKEAITYYEIKDTVYSDTSIREPNVRYTISGYGGDAKAMRQMVEKSQKLGFIADRRLEGDARVDVQAFEPPYLSHREALEQAETAIFMWAQFTNPKVLMTGGVTAKAIALALQREDAKMVGVEGCARRFMRGFLTVAGAKSSRITFKHKRPSDDLQVAQMLTMIPNLPDEWHVKLNPAIPQEMQGDIITDMEAQALGQSKADITAFEVKLKEVELKLKMKELLEAQGGDGEDE